jgi:hemoglobin
MQIAGGLDEAGLARLVPEFYAQVRIDALLGQVFNGAIADGPKHLWKLTDFWSSVMLTIGRYNGRSLPAHIRHQAEITPDMFERWLTLWKANAEQCLPREASNAVIAKAHRIAASLRKALFQLLPPTREPRSMPVRTSC